MRLAGAVVVLLATLALTSCGGDDEGDGAGDAPQERTQTAPPPTSPPATSTPAAPVPANACTLLSDDEVVDAIGEGARSQPEDGETRDDLPYSQCEWTLFNGGQADDKLTVAVIGSAQRFEEQAEDEDAEPVAGVGEDAVVFTGRFGFDLVEPGDLRGGTADTERVLFVSAGGRTLIVELNEIVVSDQADLLEQVPTERLVAIAGLALGRLDEAPAEPDQGEAMQAVVSCLEASGLDSVDADEESVFDGVEFELSAVVAGATALLAYAYDSPAEARAEGGAIQIDPALYPSRGVEGRVMALYGKALSAEVKAKAARCLSQA